VEETELLRIKGNRVHQSWQYFLLRCLEIYQVHSITALGVVINDKLTAADHLSSLLTSCSSLLYAMRVLRDHGLPVSSLHDVFCATIIVKAIYCALAWSGLCLANDCARLVAFLRRCKRCRYCTDDVAAIIVSCLLQPISLCSSVS